MIARDEALLIAREDARAVYRDLERYAEHAQLVAGGVWQVDYELRDAEAQGGGPHYRISADTGEIVERRYEQ